MALQREKGLRFGEAAVTLGFITREDVLWALSRQFNYTYAPAEVEQLNGDLVAAVNPFSTEAEYFREARSNLLAGIWSDAALKGQCKVLSVVSPDRGDGRSVFAANLAITLSMVRPSMSTISRCQPSQVTVSASLGRRPVSSIIMPLRVW